MKQVNMLEAKASLSKLVKDLEQFKEDTIYIARNGKPVVMMVRLPYQEASQRFGIAEGKFIVPEQFNEWDDETTALFPDQ